MSSPIPSITNLRRKNVKKGFPFTIMVVGASGLGKSTYINTLCGKQIITRNPNTAGLDKTINITPLTTELEEDGIKIVLTIVDTPGFGDNINNEHCFGELMTYLDRQYDDILIEESRIKRNPKFQDNRVHALIYFIPPNGHGLKEMDIQLMKRLSARVNVIPVIGKSDSLSPAEIQDFKHRVMEDIAHFSIPIYSFPYDEEDDDETMVENQELRGLLPFAVVGTDEEVIVNGRKVRGRVYPWGLVEVDNPDHCDFSKLRYTLLSSHMRELKEITEDILYEQYRTEKLSRDQDDDGALRGRSHDEVISK